MHDSSYILFMTFYFYITWNWEMFEDTKGVIKSRISKKERQYNDQKKKDKQWSTKQYTEN